MRTLTYFVATTLDGFIAGPDLADPTGSGGFWPIGEAYLDHIAQEYPETLPDAARRALGITAAGTRFDTVLEGRHSYEVGLRAGVADAYPHLRHLVFSRTMTSAPDPAVKLIGDDPLGAVRRLKQTQGLGIWLVGGGELAGALLPEIDELVLKVSSLTIGSGVPMFGSSARFEPRHWKLTDSTILDGVCFLTYARATPVGDPDGGRP